MSKYHYKAVFEDGSVVEAWPDQRDVAAFELEPFGGGLAEMMGGRPYTFARYITWSALKRARETKLTWDAFKAKCVEVEAFDDEDGDRAGGVARVISADPGQPAASAES